MPSSTELREPSRRNRARQEHHSEEQARWWPFLLVGVLAAMIGGGLVFYQSREASTRQEKGSSRQGSESEKAKEKEAIKVEVVRPREGGLARTTTQPGVVHAYEYVRLYAKASGFLRGQIVDIGDTVERGQVLAEVYAPELQQAVEQAAAAVEQAHSEVDRALAMVTVADAEVRAATATVKQREAEVGQYTATRKYRQKQFVRYNELAVSRAIDERAADEQQENFEAARAGEDVAVAAVESARGDLARAIAGVEKAKAEVKTARANVRVLEARQSAAQIYSEYTRLIAPFDGVVTERNYHDGDFIRSGDIGSETPPLLTIAKTSLMRVVLYVPDLEVPFVDRGDPAVVQIDALGGEEFTGEVSRFTDVEMAANRTMRVEVDLPNPTGRLREGMYGNVTLQLQPPSDALAVPSTALIENNGHGQGSLYVARDGKARRIKVRLGRDNGLVVEVLSGLSKDDEVITTYKGSIEDGSDIESRPAESGQEGRQG